MLHRRLCLVVLIFTLLAAAATAGPMVYFEKEEWKEALGNNASYVSDSLKGGPSEIFDLESGWELSGYKENGFYDQVSIKKDNESSYSLLSGAPMYAWGANFDTAPMDQGNGFCFSFQYVGGSSDSAQCFNSDPFLQVFIGFVFSTGVERIVLQTSTGPQSPLQETYLVWDMIAVTSMGGGGGGPGPPSPSEEPEPGSLGLFGLGVVYFGIMTRRRQE